MKFADLFPDLAPIPRKRRPLQEFKFKIIAPIAIALYVAMSYAGFTGLTAIAIANFAAAMIVGMAVTALGSLLMGVMSGSLGKHGSNAISSSGLQVNSRSSNDTVKVVYGQARVGGTWFFWTTTSDTLSQPNNELHVVIGWEIGRASCRERV